MHSLKNTVVAILLLGVSYGVYEVITTPESDLMIDQNLIAPLEIDDGLASSMPKNADPSSPHVQLPDVAANPLKSSRLPADSKAKSSQSPHSQITTTPPPTASPESLVNRQATLEFSGGSDSGEQLASAEAIEPNGDLPKDHELITALKNQLESDDELSGASEFSPEPSGKMVSVTEKPGVAPAELPRKDPNSNSLAPSTELLKNGAAPTKSNNQTSKLWDDVERLTKAGKLKEALEKLTPHFNDPALEGIQQERLLGWLDALAGKVIYSAEHNMSGQPYVVQPDETIVDIANRWGTTAQLVYNINQPNIDNPNKLQPGTELKMVTGPFHAEIDLTERIITVFVDKLYAGRFAIEVSPDSNIKEGQFRVAQKTMNGPSPDGHSGEFIITLDSGVCIHAVTPMKDTEHRSCIVLANKDAADLFAIFTEKSKFFIKR